AALNRRPIDLTIATFALFGMMNWIYNWYDPQGVMGVAELVDNITRLFLSGFLGEPCDEELNFTAPVEPFSVWRGTKIETLNS
nr:hypothetical protein [Pyrinomonadaceae bacterium]